VRSAVLSAIDGNDYSVPHTLVRSILSVVASEVEVRVLDGTSLVATHARSYDTRQVIEDPTHIAELVQEKRRARQGRGVDRLMHAAPGSQKLLQHVAERRGGLGGAVTALLRLLDEYGVVELESAISEALARGAPHPHAVRQVLERRRRERDEPLPVPVVLPDDPRVRDLVVRPHALDSCDVLRPEVTDDDTE
jgi:hypothetical protein